MGYKSKENRRDLEPASGRCGEGDSLSQPLTNTSTPIMDGQWWRWAGGVEAEMLIIHLASCIYKVYNGLLLREGVGRGVWVDGCVVFFCQYLLYSFSLSGCTYNTCI